MSFDLHSLREALAARGRVARVVVAAYDGSSPREVGASMLIWADGAGFGQSGTVGGGALEWEAAARARRMLDGAARADLTREPLGPKLGQCCGGAVTLLTEVYEVADLAALEGQSLIARPAGSATNDMPLSIRRLVNSARSRGIAPEPKLVAGWMIEPVSRPTRAIWVWGAGHVGRAIVSVLAPLPDLEITWIDVDKSRFPAVIPSGVAELTAANPADLTAYAPAHAEHLILTYSHVLDLELCHRLLTRGAAQIGLIGSATKWARFRSRLRNLGHTEARIDTIRCPIGNPDLGKHPQAIALGVAAELITTKSAEQSGKECAI